MICPAAANLCSALYRRSPHPALEDRLLGHADGGTHPVGPAYNMVVVGSVCWLRIVAAPKNDPKWDAFGVEERLKCPHVAVEGQLVPTEIHVIDVHVEMEERRLESIPFERSSPLYQLIYPI